MYKINMLSSAEKVKGQGVLSAYLEQVNLVKEGLRDSYEIYINKPQFYDIVHYHTIDLKFYLSLPFARFRGATVAYVHFVPATIDESLNLPVWVRKIFYKYMISFYRQVDHLVVVNPYFISILEEYGIDKNKIEYIPNYVSERTFCKLPSGKKKEIRKYYGLSSDKFVVLGVGQVQHRKGVLDFIEVARALPQMQFVWAGGFSFGVITEGYRELKEVVENPPENVKFLGIIERSRMNEIYNLADVMFLPSYAELFPMSVLEAMCLELPVLLRNIELYKSILFHYYLKGNSNSDFIDIISELSCNKEYYNYWSEASRKGHQFYSEEQVLRVWRQFYDKVIFEKQLGLKGRTGE